MKFDEPIRQPTFVDATAQTLMKAMEEIDQQAEDELEVLLQKYHQKICPTLKTCKGFNHKMCEDCDKKDEAEQK